MLIAERLAANSIESGCNRTRRWLAQVCANSSVVAVDVSRIQDIHRRVDIDARDTRMTNPDANQVANAPAAPPKHGGQNLERGNAPKGNTGSSRCEIGWSRNALVA